MEIVYQPPVTLISLEKYWDYKTTRRTTKQIIVACDFIKPTRYLDTDNKNFNLTS